MAGEEKTVRKVSRITVIYSASQLANFDINKNLVLKRPANSPLQSTRVKSSKEKGARLGVYL